MGHKLMAQIVNDTSPDDPAIYQIKILLIKKN